MNDLDFLNDVLGYLNSSQFNMSLVHYRDLKQLLGRIQDETKRNMRPFGLNLQPVRTALGWKVGTSLATIKYTSCSVIGYQLL
jgi:hypothetical protein